MAVFLLTEMPNYFPAQDLQESASIYRYKSIQSNAFQSEDGH